MKISKSIRWDKIVLAETSTCFGGSVDSEVGFYFVRLGTDLPNHTGLSYYEDVE